MNYLKRIEYWGDHHHPKWVDIIRIALGLFLMWKGKEFVENMSVMLDLMSSKISFNSFTMVLLGHYIVFAHLLGGFLLVIGVLVRFACLIQIPILLGAIFFINSAENVFRPFSELYLTILVLLLLIYFLIAGNGVISFNLFAAQDKR